MRGIREEKNKTWIFDQNVQNHNTGFRDLDKFELHNISIKSFNYRIV
jgi:hypothetical protein